MNLTLIALGKAGRSPEADLVARYQKRLTWPLHIVEIGERAGLKGRQRQDWEGQQILKHVPKGAMLILLDEAGKEMASQAFAQWLHRQDAGRGLAFAIGGADGHGQELRGQAQATLSLSQLTLPHMLARAVFLEQIYRASTIIAGHPYHRES